MTSILKGVVKDSKQGFKVGAIKLEFNLVDGDKVEPIKLVGDDALKYHHIAQNGVHVFCKIKEGNLVDMGLIEEL